MALAHEEYLHEADFDAVVDIIESNFLEHDDEFQQDIDLTVEKIPTINNSTSYQCSFQPKFAFQKVDTPGISALNITQKQLNQTQK